MNTQLEQFTQKYSILSLLEDRPESYEFTRDNWPLHTTIVDTFKVNWEKSILVEKFIETATPLIPLTTTALQDTCFGPHKDIPVTLLDRTTEFFELHKKLLRLLRRGGLILSEPQYSEDGFVPHITVQRNARVNAGETVSITNLAVIDMFPDNDGTRRKILKIVHL